MSACAALLPLGSDSVTPGMRWNSVSVTIGDSMRWKSSEVSVWTVPGTLLRSMSAPSGDVATTLRSGSAMVSFCASADAGDSTSNVKITHKLARKVPVPP